jgi:hypothetical protein
MEEHVERAFQNAATCLAGTFDGNGFRDPYLTYVYPGENLPLPKGGPRLTYRMIDADTVLVLLGRAGRVPASLEGAVEKAGASLRGVLPVWRGSGIYNLRKAPSPNGVALDTYCFVGWLYQDREIASVVAADRDGDGWLPEKMYAGEERFRLDADESWCLRLLASPAGPGIEEAAPVIDRIASTLHRETASDPSGSAAFYEAFHLAMVLSEAERSRKGLPSRHRPLEDDVVAAFSAWASARGGDAASEARDILEWANLAAADLPDGVGSASLRARAIDVLLRGQSADGCFRIPGASPPGSGTSFLTLRALLALAPLRPPSPERVPRN